MPFDPGTKIGDFQILRQIGRGAMGEVYLAEQPSLRRNVALKILNPSLGSDPALMERFRREALNAARLRHGAIVPVFTAGEHNGVHYIAMDFIEGRSLDRVLTEMEERKVQPAPELIASFLRIAIEIAEALHFAHEEGMLHRDIKPSNILLDKRGRPYLGDFGLARHRFDSPLTISGDMIGTPRYMAPEMLDAKIGPIDRRADIYSLGATWYELLTLHPPFDGEGLQELFSRINSGITDPASRRNPMIPEKLSRILDRALSRNPNERFASAKALAEALRDVLQTDLSACNSDSSFAALLGSLRSEHVETPRPGTQPTPPKPETNAAHELVSTNWMQRVPVPAIGICIASLAVGFVWRETVLETHGMSRKMIFGAYPFAFFAFMNAIPFRYPKEKRILPWLVVVGAGYLCFESLRIPDVHAIRFVIGALFIASHYLYDRWVQRGEKNHFLVLIFPYLLAVVLLSTSAGSESLLLILGNLLGYIALFSITTSLMILPAFFWNDLVGAMTPAFRRCLYVGLPTGVLYLLIQAAF